MTSLLSVLVLAASTAATSFTLSDPAQCSSTPAPVEHAIFAGGAAVKATCTVSCGLYGSVSCSGTTCNAVNRSCPGEAGHVTCGTTTKYCPFCCADGQTKWEIAGPTCGCEDGQSTPIDQYLCVNGEWEYQYSFCDAPFCQGF